MEDRIAIRIGELEGERRQDLRQASRARARRREAQRKLVRHPRAPKADRRRWREGAQAAREVAALHNEAAQEHLRHVRTLRRERKEKNAAVRLLRHRRSAGKASDGGPLYWFDGVKVRPIIYEHLVWARTKGHNGLKWKGRVTSGYRTPEYSRSLCFAICGAPSCAGRCAGTASNHVRTAVDLTDFYTFGRLMPFSPYSPHIFNGLGSRDPVHFSPSGN